MDDQALFFEFRCWKGLKQRKLDHLPEYAERLEFEIETIHNMAFEGYFLLVSDFINWARRNGILVGPGRGSGAGSLCCYVLEITDLDPIRYGLLFERFLNPDRISMPDLDIDFPKDSRHRVIEYVIEKYGTNRVAHIGTFNMNRAKNAVRSIARALGHPYEIGDELSRLLLAPIAGKPQPISTSIAMVPELQKYLEKGGTRAHILQLATQVEGLISSSGVHASGVVIANEDMTNSLPLFRGKSGEITTQWEMNTIEDVGYIKFDFLGLDALSKIQKCLALIDEPIDVRNLPHDDKVFENIRTGNVVGMFQLEASSGMQDLVVKVQPQNLEDLCAIVALYRPGPLASGYADTYVEVKAGRQEATYLVPDMKPILENTYSIILYQEQIMHMARELCGYTRGEADELRKAVGKKKLELLQKHEPKFKDGWEANGYDRQLADGLWEDLLNFADYCFNKSHALAYAYITYITAYLKTHYPAEFMCAVMICEGSSRDDIIKCITECKRLGIKVLPPDINKSGTSFSVSGDNEIRFGLGPIKNLGEKPVESIIKERRGGKFTSLLNFCERIDSGAINRLKVESLIRAGAFDSLHESRRAMLETIEKVWSWRDEKKRYESKRDTFYKKLEAYEQRLKDIEEGKLSETGKKLKSLKKPDPPDAPVAVDMSEVDEMSEQELQKNEHELLGFFVSSHPLENIRHVYNGVNIHSIDMVKQLESSVRVGLAVVITTQTEITTKKKKQKMGFLHLEDLSGGIEAVLFPSTYAKCKDKIVEGEPLLIEGKIDITQTDDGKVTKLIVDSIIPIKRNTRSTNELLEANVSIEKADKLLKLLERYKGNTYQVRISLKTLDGTKFKIPGTHSIGDYKGIFIHKVGLLG